MADWYVSSATYALIPVFQTAHAYVVGDLIKPTAPAFNAQFVFRCTTAGTSGAEPIWTNYPAYNNNGTVTSGTVTFTNVTGQSAYGWAAAGGSVYTYSFNSYSRGSVGDRIFVSSDHNETNTSGSGIYYVFNSQTVFAFGQVQLFSVNRGGSVPPITTDLTVGAVIANNGSGTYLDATCDVYWYGFKFISSIPTAGGIFFGNWGTRTVYLKNCVVQITSTAAAPQIQAGTMIRLVLDNTLFQFANIAQQIVTQQPTFEIVWYNTQFAVQGAAPSALFQNAGSYGSMSVLCRGVDLSAVTGKLFEPGVHTFKMLLDRCHIAPGVIRYPSTLTVSNPSCQDEVELVDCYDGTNIVNERWTLAGSVISDRTVTLTNGAIDDVGQFSSKMTSNSHVDSWGLPLTAFQLDVENTLTGARTATLEVLSNAAALNNADIALLLEYEGTTGSPVASFTDSLPPPLGPSTSLPTSSNTWNNQPASGFSTWNPGDRSSANIVLSNVNMTMGSSISTNEAVRSTLGATAGKLYFEITWNVAPTGANTGCGVAYAGAVLGGALNSSASGGLITYGTNGNIWYNGFNTGLTLGAFALGNTTCVAIDLPNMRGYLRKGAGLWNGTAGADPASNTGGIDILAVFAANAVFAAVTANMLANPLATVNFGATAFAQTVPSGFASMNTYFAVVKQLLQASFTPQGAGRVRGLVRLIRPNCTVWINPQILIA